MQTVFNIVFAWGDQAQSTIDNRQNGIKKSATVVCRRRYTLVGGLCRRDHWSCRLGNRVKRPDCSEFPDIRIVYCGRILCLVQKPTKLNKKGTSSRMDESCSFYGSCSRRRIVSSISGFQFFGFARAPQETPALHSPNFQNTKPLLPLAVA